MGNEVSSSEVEEEQEGPVKERNPEFAVEVQNGPITAQTSPAVNAAPGANYGSSKQVTQQENVIASSQKTIILSPISNGSVSAPPPPAAKSKFRLTISRTSFQPSGLGDVGPTKPQITFQESPVVQTQLMTPLGPDGAVVKENVGGVQNAAPPSALIAADISLPPPAKPSEEQAATTKLKEVSVFHKMFKPERKTQPEVTINQPLVITVNPRSPPDAELLSQSEEEQSTAEPAQSTPPAEPTQDTPPAEPTQDTPPAEPTQDTSPAELHPVMSFFKTLVTPNKSVPKSEEEVKGEGEDKSKKEEQQTSKVFLEQSVVSVSVTPEKSPPEQDPKSSDVPTQIPASEEEGRAAREPSAPRPKLFWRKSFKGQPEASKMQQNGVEEAAAAQPVSANSAPEQIAVQDSKPRDSNVQLQENETPAVETSSRSVPFWRKSFKGDPPARKYQDNVVVEQPLVSVSVTSEKSTPGAILTPDSKPLDSDAPQQESQTPQKEAAGRPVPFWRKSFKADPPPQKVPENVVVEQPVVSVTSEKSPPEQILTPDTQPLVSDTQPESQNPPKEAAARPVPFWRKSFKGDPQTANVPENSLPEETETVRLTPTSSEPEPQSSKSNPGDKGAAPGSKSPQNKKPDDGKSAKPKIMMFFKQLSVMGDGSYIRPEESNENSRPEPTLDITDGVEVSKNEKTVVTAVVEPPPPPPQKGKDSVKEKKASAEKLNKQESRESTEAAQLQAPDPVQVEIGVGASRDGQLKRTEKRQSLGNFFKAIGPKRMCDAEVQTEPVTVLPADKTK